MRRPARLLLLLLLAAPLVPGCATHEPPPPPPPPRGEPLPPAVPPGQAERRDEEPGPVRVVEEPIVVAAWAEPRQLPAGGGQVQILVRVQHRGGARFSGVEVRLRSSEGSLYSAGSVLVTDAQGMTRDRLTAHRSSVVTLNAGGTRYRFEVPVAEPER